MAKRAGITTVEAVIRADGMVRLTEPVSLAGTWRALVTILDEAPLIVWETACLSEAVLAVDWHRPEENAAWAQVQPAP